MILEKHERDFYYANKMIYVGKVYFGSKYWHRDINRGLIKRNTFSYKNSYFL